MELKEIPPFTWEERGYKKADKKCPHAFTCGGELYYGPVRCPDVDYNRMGCLVMHYGFTCSKCDRQYQ